MAPEIARAFVVRQLSRSQLEELYRLEDQLPLPTECMNSYQIVNHFKLWSGRTLSEAEVKAMDKLWLEFFTAILYPQQQAEEAFHPSGCTMSTCYHPWDPRCKTKAQEMQQWDDYARTSYKAPATGGKLDAVLGCLMAIAVFKR